MGQALVDTNRLKIVSSLDPLFRDEMNLFLELGEAAFFKPEPKSRPVDSDMPKWFQHLPENVESEIESSVSGVTTPQASLHYRNPPSDADSLEQGRVVSLASLTGREAAPSDDRTAEEDSKVSASDSYLVVGELDTDELSAESERESCQTCQAVPTVRVSEDGSIFIPVPASVSSLSPVASPARVRSLRRESGGYTLIDNQDVLKAIPVSGLSSAAEAARVIVSSSQEGTTSLKSNEEAKVHFDREHDRHFHALIVQFMQTLGLSLNWIGIIKPLIYSACQQVQTNIFVEDIMDINEYAKVKKIPTGTPKDSAIVYGVVCSKNITHKKLSHSLQNPTILLLKCAFEFQRKENQLSSFDTLQLQEEKYLKNLVARVKTFKPSIILVQKSVSRLALEMLHALEIVVAVNVKPTVMARVARSTQGDLLHSLDQLFFDVRLGSCGQFYVKDFTLSEGIKKTLMYFTDCEPRLGCAITLRGSSMRELRKVKKVVRFGLHMAFNAYLETAFLVEEFAWPASSDEQQPLPSARDCPSTCSTPERPLYPSIACPVEESTTEELAAKLALLNVSVGNEGQLEVSGEHGSNSPVNHLQTDDDKYRCPPNPSDQNENEGGGKGEVLLSPVSTEADEEAKGQPSTGRATPVDQGTTLDGTPLFSSAADTGDLLSLVDKDTLDQLGDREFQRALDNTVLSSSPNVRLPTPYLQSAQGREASARHYLPKVIYWSYQFKPQSQPASQNRLLPPLLSLEMGLSKERVMQVHGQYQARKSSDVTKEVPVAPSTLSPPLQQHSYLSVSTHPLTSSLLVLDANTNEMKAALADFRARAGSAKHPGAFFFPSAREACNFHLHLQNTFNKYSHFELLANGNPATRKRDGEDGEVSGICPAGTEKTEKSMRVRRKRRRTVDSKSSTGDMSRESSPLQGRELAEPSVEKQGAACAVSECQESKGALAGDSERSKSAAEASRATDPAAAGKKELTQGLGNSQTMHSDDVDAASQKRLKSPLKVNSLKRVVELSPKYENFESLDRSPGSKATHPAAANKDGGDSVSHELDEGYSYFGMDLGMASYVVSRVKMCSSSNLARN